MIDSKRLLHQLGLQLVEIAQRQGNIPRRTGFLHRSVNVYHVDERVCIVGSDRVYARAVHDGAVIRPKNKKMLAFPPPPGWKGPISKKTGLALARKVTIKPNPYLARAAEQFVREGVPPGIREWIGDAVADDLERTLRATGLKVTRG